MEISEINAFMYFRFYSVKIKLNKKNVEMFPKMKIKKLEKLVINHCRLPNKSFSFIESCQLLKLKELIICTIFHHLV